MLVWFHSRRNCSRSSRVNRGRRARGLLWVGHHASQQPLPVPGHTRDGVRLKEVCVVFQRTNKPLRSLLHGERQIKSGGLAAPRPACSLLYVSQINGTSW